MTEKLLVSAGALIVAFGAAVTYLYRRDLRAARRRITTGSAIADTKVGPIEYAENGKGSPVLIVHGAGGGFDQGVALGDGLANKGFRVIAMSRFGYLRTAMPTDASPAAQADAHVALMDVLGIEKAAVVGFSAGAPSSAQLAIRHPDRVSALVLVVPAIYSPRADNAASLQSPPATAFLVSTALKSNFLFWAWRRAAKKMFIRSILATPPEDLERVSPAERVRVDQVLDRILPVSPRRLGLMNDVAITSTIARYELERITAPTLCISVADDQFGTFGGARYSAEYIPDARFVGYASGGHILAGHEDDLLREITTLLDEVNGPHPSSRPRIATGLHGMQTTEARVAQPS